MAVATGPSLRIGTAGLGPDGVAVMICPVTTGRQKRDVVVVLSGGPGEPAGVSIPAGAVVVAADSGVRHARTLGLAVDLLVGDLDSISAEELAAIDSSDVPVERHPIEKDATDLELALAAAARFAPGRIVVLGGGAGRFDQLFGEVLLLASDAVSGATVDAQLGPAVVHVVRGERRFSGRPGELVSLFAVHGPAEGVTTAGLVYPLRGEVLEPGSTRGVSNALVSHQARVSVERGVVVVVRPDGLLVL